MKSSGRIVGLDILRSIAILLVMVTHMFNYTGMLSADTHTFNWGVSNMLHYFSMICVPLFLLLTGYLQSHREISVRHYSSIIPILISYFFISAVNAILMVRFFGMPEFPDGSGIKNLVMHIFDYTFGYAWYVEMYISLFMLIPFLNILFHALSKRKQQYLIAILVIVTMLPAFLRSFLVSGMYLRIMPDFLENMYVITYYFIGAYIAEHKPKPKRITCAAAGFAVLLFESVCCWIFTDTEYAWWLFNSNASVTHAVTAVCVFLILYQVDFKNRPAKFVISEISICSFEMYLISFFTDRYMYSHMPVSSWQMVLLIDILLAYSAAKIARIALVPVSRYLKSMCSKVNKVLHNKTAES